jgi:ABC-type glycerol-3-phosphate transport system substrate-binding protein
MRKTRLLCFTVVLLSFALLAGAVFAGPITGPEAAKINWKQFQGTTIRVLFCNHPWQEAVEPLLPDFEKLTGIKLDYSRLPEIEFQTKKNSGFAAGTFDYDVYMSQFFDAPKHCLEKWVADMEPYLNDPELTDPAWYDWNDFFPGQRDIATAGNTYFNAIPITTEVQVLIYRSDVYEKLGLKPPDTFEQLIDTCKTIQSKMKGMNGLTIRGGPHLWWPFYGVLKSFGGEYFDKSNKPVINTPEAKAAVKMYVEMAKYTPRGITTYGWDEINTAILSGKAAQFLDSSVAYSRLQDPSKSTVAGKIKVAPFPKGPKARSPHSYSWSISIAESSGEKEASWLFIEWITSKDVMYKLGMKGVLSPRAAVWNEPSFQKQFSPDYVQSAQKSLEGAVVAPPNMRFWEMVDLLDKEVQKAILGQQTADQAVENTQKLWDGMKM